MRASEDRIQAHVFAKGSYIELPDPQSGMIYFLYEGSIRIGDRDHTGHERTKAILTKGEVFGQMPGIHPEQKDFLYALSPVKVFALTVDELQQLMHTHSGFYLFCMKLCGSKRMEMERRLPLLVYKDARTRIVELFQELIKTRGYQDGSVWRIKNFVTERQIARLTATSRHTVNHVLNDLRAKGMISYQRCQLVIKSGLTP